LIFFSKLVLKILLYHRHWSF